ncbi:hypothetical protein [Micromonospora sp. NPDC050695]|uniref:hypothetical protein n=1 Tax=Micromonospora sp. NPDC050695 TaxID=3154938 RepID=UPI0033ED99FF
MERQREAGVRVGLLPLGVVGAQLHVNLTLWDGSSCWEARMTAHGEIDRLTRVFDLCASAATLRD